MTRKELYNICHDEAVAYANSEQWSKRTGEEKLFLIQGYLDAMMETRKSKITEKKKEYPKSYVECCYTLYRNSRHDECYEACLQGHPMQTFARLLICRDAYWKIAGEMMGLGKPWIPDWNTSEPKYVIAYTSRGIEKQWETTYCKGLAFPTEEMRDAFKENFDPNIEFCKEFL